MTSETRQEKVLRDQEARHVIVRALDRNVMVLAGAGAGKTHALIERMVATVREGVCEVDRMAAITFTRKAAGEMRGRFFLRLREEMRKVSDPDSAARVRAALERIDQCFIGTIHAFCGRLLRERPIEAGLTPEFTEIDDREEARLRRDAWDRFVQERYVKGDPRLDALEEHGIHPEDLYGFFGRRCMNADLPLKQTSTAKPDLMPYVVEIEAFIDRVAPCIPSDPEKRDGLMNSVRRARHFLANHGLESGRDAAELIGMFERSVGVTLKHWDDVNTAREIRDELLPRLQESVVEPTLRLWREHAYRLTTDLVDDAVAYYESLRLEEGKLTFQDLLLRTADLLRSAPHVRTYFQRRYRVILVDEFQDTDPVQARILFYLTGEDVAETDWRRLVPEPGRLFLVGDDKQSIYRFRRADVEIFRFVTDRIRATGGEVVHLNTSFRSLGTLCRWISDAFPDVFGADTDRYQAAFEPLYEYRCEGADPHCVRTITVPKVSRNLSADIAALDAERIAGFIAAAMRGATEFNRSGEGSILGEKASAGDFLILTPTTKQLSTYASALEAAGIPFDVVGGGRLGESTEVAAFVTMMEALHTPENPVPFVSYLRGPLAGLSDGELYEIRKAGGRLELEADIPEQLAEPLRARLVEAVEQLERAAADLAALPPGAAMERTLERTGLLALSGAHPDGGSSSRAGNLVRLLSLVRKQAAHGWHWGRIVDDLRGMVDDADYKVEQMTLESGREDVVRVMNMHQAKGLQAPVVFLANPYDTSYDQDPTSHVARAGDASYISMTVTKPKGDHGRETVAQPEGWADDEAEEKRFEAAERIRRLYVAATRAQNMLVVSHYPPKSNEGLWAPLTPHLADVPELAGYPAGKVEKAREPSLSFAELCTEADERLRASKVPTYHVGTVTGRRVEDELEVIGREGRGRDYGVVVHRLYEEAVRGALPDDLEPYVASAIRGEGLPASLLQDALAALDRLRASSLWRRIEEADAVHTEVPVGVRTERGVVRGVIDLVYRDDEGWHIVDYKTDAAATEEEADALRAKYAPQLDAYRDYWNRMADAPVASAELFLVHGPSGEGQLALF